MDKSNKVERGIVVFDSKFGNTERVAKSLQYGLQRAGVETACLNIRDVQVESLAEHDLIAIGAPTQALTASRPMKDFLQKLQEGPSMKGKCGFAFDTKFRNRLAGSGAKFIEKKLTQLGMEIIRPRQSAIVKKTDGPLEEGEEQAFERTGYEIGATLTKDEYARPSS